MDFYDRRYRFKLVLIAAALVISAVSIYYTSQIVATLADRERKLIDLNAKAYKAISEIEDGADQSFLLTEIIAANNSIPVILTDEDGNYQSDRNLDLPDNMSEEAFKKRIDEELELMKEEYEPIPLELAGIKQFIYYRNSKLITQLRYYPLVQLGVIAVFGFISYLAFSNSRRAEQNRVWVGLAKETAHQLGTPLSSLMAWVEYLRSDERFAEDGIADELEKDVKRLEMITDRFSNIGSQPILKHEDIRPTLEGILDYLRKRISTKVTFTLEAPEVMYAVFNKPLFEWVLENVIKNGVDAMNGNGSITISAFPSIKGMAVIDITDTGKGIKKEQFSKVFEPGFTTKKRGWGLGLTLVKRIVSDYHKGKIFVRYSELGKGTTFRILLPMNKKDATA